MLHSIGEAKSFMLSVILFFVSWLPSGAAGDMAPKMPLIRDFLMYTDDIGFGVVKIDLYSETADGQMLPADNLFFCVYLDSEKLPFVLSDGEEFSATVTDMPYWEGCSSVYQILDSWFVYFYHGGFSRLGVQSVYIDADGKRHESAIAWVKADGSVDGIGRQNHVNPSSVESVTFTDPLGRRIQSPRNGMFIETIKYSDGSTKKIKRTLK